MSAPPDPEWASILATMRISGTATHAIRLLKKNVSIGANQLLDISRLMPAELPAPDQLLELCTLLRQHLPEWILSADYSTLLRGCRAGLSHQNQQLRQCWGRVLELLLHEHLHRLNFGSLLLVFELSSEIDPNTNLKCRWLGALREMLQHHYRYAYVHQTSLPLQALVPIADDVTKFQSRFLTDANASVRGQAAALLRLLVPLADADLLVSCVPALLRCIEMVTKQTQISPRGRANTCSSSSNSDQSTRAKVNDEIISTEISYIDGIERLLTIRQQLRPLVPEPKLAVLFGNIDNLLALHKFLLSDLQQCSCSTICACTAAVFLRYADVFKMYTAYVNGFESALAVLSALKTHAGFASWVSGVGAGAHAQLTSLLIAPIQRIPRYLLLLQKLQRHTPASSGPALLSALQKAVDKILFIADHLNESKKRAESLGQVVALHQRMSGRCPPLLAPNRRLLKQCSAKKRTTSTSALRRKHLRLVFLFSDVVLWCTPTYRFKGIAGLAKARLECYDARTYYSLDILTVPSERDVPLEFATRSERDEWRDAVQGAIDTISERRASRNAESLRIRNARQQDLKRALLVPAPKATPKQHHHHHHLMAPLDAVIPPDTLPVPLNQQRPLRRGSRAHGADASAAATEAVAALSTMIGVYEPSGVLGSGTLDLVSDAMRDAVHTLVDVHVEHEALMCRLLAYCRERLQNVQSGKCPGRTLSFYSQSEVSSHIPSAVSPVSRANRLVFGGHIGTDAEGDDSPLYSDDDDGSASFGGGDEEEAAEEFALQLMPDLIRLLPLCRSPLRLNEVFRAAGNCLAACAEQVPAAFAETVADTLQRELLSVHSNDDDTTTTTTAAADNWKREGAAIYLLGLAAEVRHSSLVSEAASIEHEAIDGLASFASITLSALAPPNASSASRIWHPEVVELACWSARRICKRRLHWLSVSRCHAALQAVVHRVQESAPAPAPAPAHGPAVSAAAEVPLVHSLWALIHILERQTQLFAPAELDSVARALLVRLQQQQQQQQQEQPEEAPVQGALLACLAKCQRSVLLQCDAERTLLRVLDRSVDARVTSTTAALLADLVSAEFAPAVLRVVASQLERAWRRFDSVGVVQLVHVVTSCTQVLSANEFAPYQEMLVPLLRQILLDLSAHSQMRHVKAPALTPASGALSISMRRERVIETVLEASINVASLCPSTPYALQIGQALLAVFTRARQALLLQALGEHLLGESQELQQHNEPQRQQERASSDPNELSIVVQSLSGLSTLLMLVQPPSLVQDLGQSLVWSIADTLEKLPPAAVVGSHSASPIPPGTFSSVPAQAQPQQQAGWAQLLYARLLDSWTAVTSALFSDSVQMRSQLVLRQVVAVLCWSTVPRDADERQTMLTQMQPLEHEELLRLPPLVMSASIGLLSDLLVLHNSQFLNEVLKLAPLLGTALRWPTDVKVQENAAGLLQHLARRIDSQRLAALLHDRDDICSGLVLCLQSVVTATRRSACVCVAHVLRRLHSWEQLHALLGRRTLREALTQALPLGAASASASPTLCTSPSRLSLPGCSSGSSDSTNAEYILKENVLICESLNHVLRLSSPATSSASNWKSQGVVAVCVPRAAQKLAACVLGRLPALSERAVLANSVSLASQCCRLSEAVQQLLGSKLHRQICEEWSGQQSELVRRATLLVS